MTFLLPPNLSAFSRERQREHCARKASRAAAATPLRRCGSRRAIRATRMSAESGPPQRLACAAQLEFHLDHRSIRIPRKWLARASRNELRTLIERGTWRSGHNPKSNAALSAGRRPSSYGSQQCRPNANSTRTRSNPHSSEATDGRIRLIIEREHHAHRIPIEFGDMSRSDEAEPLFVGALAGR